MFADQSTPVIAIEPLGKPFTADVAVPGSKSMTNRALILAALADGTTTIENALTSDDTEYMVGALSKLGFQIESDATAATMTVVGHHGAIPSVDADLFVGASGTCARFLTALVALGHGEYRLDGVPRMRERPIIPLLDALNQIGSRATSTLGTGCLPVNVRAMGIRGGTATMNASVSSQFISALLMITPYANAAVEIRLEGTIVSRPYIDMTIQQMARHGVTAGWRDERTLFIEAGSAYRAGHQIMESDASNASYFFAAAAVTGGHVRIPRLPVDSIQGDLALLDVLAQMGCMVTRDGDTVEVRGPAVLRGLTIDANAFPDVAQTIAALAPFAEGPTEVRNVASMRVKETDRIEAVVTELRRLGQEVTAGPDWFRVEPRPITPATIHTYDDHRMAMAFSIIGLRAHGVRIADPSCVAKTFPTYWKVLAAAGVSIHPMEPVPV